MNRILIVEDEKPISNLIKTNLSDAGYHCTCAFDGEEAANLIEKESFDLILLDIMLPKINGYELIEYIKNFKTPVIFLTAKSDVLDKVKGLKLGAEDYLTKPFEIIELLARVETVLRRYHKNEEMLRVDDVTIDTLSRVVKKNDEIINLTVKEYEILLLFVRNKNIALFRDRIYKKVWGDVFMGDTRTNEKQERLFNNKIENYKAKGYSEEDAKKEAAKWVAVPGTSEHQLGLSVDIVSLNNQMLDESQEKTEEQKWLMKNSYKYGFILRYPSDKIEITGIGYEPWHYRYVGKEAAAEITQKGIALEEYLGNL